MTDAVLPRADAESIREAPMRLHPVDDLSDALLVTPWIRPDLHHTWAAAGPRALGTVPDL